MLPPAYSGCVDGAVCTHIPRSPSQCWISSGIPILTHSDIPIHKPSPHFYISISPFITPPPSNVSHPSKLSGSWMAEGISARGALSLPYMVRNKVTFCGVKTLVDGDSTVSTPPVVGSTCGSCSLTSASCSVPPPSPLPSSCSLGIVGAAPYSFSSSLSPTSIGFPP